MRSLTISLLLIPLLACSDDSSTSNNDAATYDTQKALEAGSDQATADGPATDKMAADLPTKDILKPPTEAGACPPGHFLLKNMGKDRCVKLPAGVTLPVDSSTEADAIKAATQCSCKCDPGWTQKAGKWRCYCCSKYPDCLVEIDAATGATRCELYG